MFMFIASLNPIAQIFDLLSHCSIIEWDFIVYHVAWDSSNRNFRDDLIY